MIHAYQRSIGELEQELSVQIDAGLSSQEAKLRLERDGPNKLPQKEAPGPIIIFLRQFASPLMFVLFFAAIISVLIGERGDAVVIGLAVAINVILGFFQEWKAERAAEMLRAFEVPQTLVRRDGVEKEIPAVELVVGDVVLLEEGMRVPADLRLCHVSLLEADEALLTGESQPVEKKTVVIDGEHVISDRYNMAFMGTFVASGRGVGIVVATGLATQLGHIAQLVTSTEHDITPIQRQLQRFSWLLGAFMIGICGLVAIVGFVRRMPIHEVLSISIALAVAAIPEGLLIAVTVVLAIGMQRMMRRQALMRRLVAAEALGSVSVICTDKTGTLTQGHLSVAEIVTMNHDPADVDTLMRAGVLNNNAHFEEGVVTSGDPIERALLESAISQGLSIEQVQRAAPRVDELPFSSDRMFMATLHDVNGSREVIIKGAPEQIFAMCQLDPEQKKEMLERLNDMTSRALRVIGFARSGKQSLDGTLSGCEFLGLVGLEDALRESTPGTIEELSCAGIRTVVITGDHVNTARSIAKEAGIISKENGVIDGLALEKLTDEELLARIEEFSVFSRVDPRHKVRIVKAWQDDGNFVAMIGDGVNDAPAIRQADIGVSVGSGSDLTHEIADMVLLDDNLATIAAAVREGRIIFDNIRKVITYLLADSFSEIVLVAGALLLGLPLPMYAVQILWINLVSDGFPSLALTMEPGEPDIMEQPPRPKDEPIVNTEMKFIIFLIGLVTDIGLFGLYFFLYSRGYDLEHLRTVMFTALSIDSLFFVFAVRSLRRSIFRMNPFGNVWLLPAVGIGLLFQFAVVYVPALQELFYTMPLNATDWIVLAGLSFFKIICIEVTKEFFISKMKT